MNESKLLIELLFGGRSGEHEVSIISAGAISNITREFGSDLRTAYFLERAITSATRELSSDR